MFMAAGPAARSANVLFVSDNPDPDNSFYPPLVGFPDDFYVIMLQNAGHNVIRFNPPNSQNTLLTAAQLAAINTNDLIVVSRSIASAGFQAPQSSNWNARVTKPLIMTSPYLVRQDGNRLTWFVGGNGVLPDTTPPTFMRAMDTADPETAFLFTDVAMNGATMVDSFDEPFLFNTSTITNPVATGGKSLATASFIERGTTTPRIGQIIAEFPAGTAVPVAAGTALGGYRMFVAAGSREGNGVSIPLGAGADNLTPAGEKVFMRAIQLALNNGVSPVTYSGPVGFETQPVSVTVMEGSPVTISVTVTGALPRLVEWQRDEANAGATFTNIPGASSVLGKSQVFLPKVKLADNGAMFQAIASNSFGMVTSVVAQLTVVADTNPPTIIATRSKWTMTNIFLTFSEPVDKLSAEDVLNYNIDNGLSIDSVTLDGTGTNLTIRTTPQTPGTLYTVTVSGVTDVAETPNIIAEGTTVSFTAFVESRGFLVSEIFTGMAAGNAISLLTSFSNYPHSPNISGYVNISSNPPAIGEQYGGRLVGSLIPPTDGSYTFYIRGDDDTELRLNGAVVASRAGANGTFLQSNPQTVPLIGGQAYVVEALWKEGTGGDYMQFAWATPWNTNIHAIAGSYFQTYAPGEGVSVNITSQPVGSAVEENRSATFSVAASSTPVNALRSYQWQKGDGAGGFTNALGAQYGATFTTDLLQYPDDDGSQWRVIVYVPGGSATSDVATVTVSDDVTSAVALSAGSLDGLTVGVCFSEMIETETGTDPFNYGVTAGGGSPSITAVTLRADRRSVILSLAPPAISGPITVSVNGVNDLAGNPGGLFELASTVVGLSGAELGPNAQAGTDWTCEADTFEVIAGGADIWGTLDTGRFASRSVTGDFDAKIRVNDLTLTANTGGALIAKAGLMARATAATNSQTIWLLGNPPPPGRDIIEAGFRPTSGGATVGWGPNETNVHMPNMWFRLTRAGNTYDGYVSSNGVDWALLANTNTTALPGTVLLGAAVTAHNNVAGLASTGRFSNFSVTQPLADLSVTKSAAGSVYVGSNITYTITVANTGPDGANLVTVTDPIPAGTAHVSSSTTQGSCTLTAGVLNCALGAIPSGGSATITLVTSTSTEGTKTNTATVASSTVDPNPANNTASVEVSVFGKPVINNLNYNAGAGTFSLSIQTHTGFSYRVEYKNQLTDPAWSLLTTVVGDGTVQAITDPGPLPPTRFYRVVVE